MSEEAYIVIGDDQVALVPTCEFRWLVETGPHWSGQVADAPRLQQKWTAKGFVAQEERWRDVPVVMVAKSGLEHQ